MGELQNRMNAREFGEWQAFYNLHPFGPVWADIRAAALMALLAEINRDPRRRHRPFTLADFMPEGWAGRGAEPSEGALMDKIKRFAASLKDQHGDTK